MIQCTNCGQVNNDTSNFCRFCGSKFVENPPVEQQSGFEYAPPRPYSWKTDEYQVSDNRKSARPQQIKQVQPLGNPWITQQSSRPQPLVHQQPQNLAHGYQCPRCASQAMPYVSRRVSTAGWITFAVLLVTTGIFFWIGLLIREDVRTCPVCNFKYN